MSDETDRASIVHSSRRIAITGLGAVTPVGNDVDTTWDAGSVSGVEFTRGYRSAHFLAPPEVMGVTHFPDEPRWQLRDPPLGGVQILHRDLHVLLEWVEREEAAGEGEAPYPPQFPKMPGEPKRVQPSRAKKKE